MTDDAGVQPAEAGAEIHDSPARVPTPSEVARARPIGFEPMTRGLEGRRSVQLSYGRRIRKSGRPDSNRGPPAPKAGALPNCATPRREQEILAAGGGVVNPETTRSEPARWPSATVLSVALDTTGLPDVARHHRDGVIGRTMLPHRGAACDAVHRPGGFTRPAGCGLYRGRPYPATPGWIHATCRARPVSSATVAPATTRGSCTCQSRPASGATSNGRG
jgi:hypothetical protein